MTPEKSLAELLSSVKSSETETYSDVKNSLVQADRVFREWLATSLTPALRQQVAMMPSKTVEEKRTVAHWVNDELREFRLAVKCPNTGKPSIVEATTASRSQDGGSFRFEIVDDDLRRTFKCYTPNLDSLSLMPSSMDRTNSALARRRRHSDGSQR